MKLRELMNPWKVGAKDRKQIDRRIDQSCQTCHDLDNSREYTFEDTREGSVLRPGYWDSEKHKTAHYNPKPKE
jgi:hypothetical protein